MTLRGDPVAKQAPILDSAFFERLYPSLRRFAAAVASSDVDPDDLVQEALVGALRAGSLRGVDDPGAYLRRAILNVETSHRRRAARWRSRASRVIGLDVEHPSYPSDLDVLDGLAPSDRALLYLVIVEDLPYSVVADYLDLPEASLRKRMTRARRRLERLLAQEGRS